MSCMRYPQIVAFLTCIVLAVALRAAGNAQPVYEGTLRVYVVEETSRWHDSYGSSFTNGFLDWALVAYSDDSAGLFRAKTPSHSERLRRVIPEQGAGRRSVATRVL